MSKNQRIEELEAQVEILANGLKKVCLLSSGRSEGRWAQEALAEAGIPDWTPDESHDIWKNDAERNKELKARVAELELFAAQIAHRFVPKKVRLHHLRELCFSESSQARALLKETSNDPY